MDTSPSRVNGKMMSAQYAGGIFLELVSPYQRAVNRRMNLSDQMITEHGYFRKGKHKRKSLVTVAQQEPGYLRWVLRKVNESRAQIGARMALEGKNHDDIKEAIQAPLQPSWYPNRLDREAMQRAELPYT